MEFGDRERVMMDSKAKKILTSTFGQPAVGNRAGWQTAAQKILSMRRIKV